MSKTQTSGRFVWHELHARDVEAAKGFYGELFGWKTKSMDMGPMGTYTIFSAGDQDVGGAMKLQGPAPAWLAYCTTPDVDAAVGRAKGKGAKVLMGPDNIPGVGRYAVLSHDGAGIVAPYCGDEESPEVEKPAVGTFCWDEIITQDPKAAIAFLKEVFNYGTEEKDMGPMGVYTILKRGDRMAGGVMKAFDPKAPAGTISYVAVGDVDASLARAKKLGGKEITGAADIPGTGRFAVVSDLDGAVFALFKGA